jgi:hypothetical protein
MRQMEWLWHQLELRCCVFLCCFLVVFGHSFQINKQLLLMSYLYTQTSNKIYYQCGVIVFTCVKYMSVARLFLEGSNLISDVEEVSWKYKREWRTGTVRASRLE